MVKFIAEKSLWEIFLTFIVYFASTIELLGWEYLISDPTSYFIHILAEEFYMNL